MPGVLHAGKTGFLYVHDRRDCHLIRASDPLVPQTNMYAPPTREGTRIAPGTNGGVGWSPIAVDAAAGIAYAVTLHQTMSYTYQPSAYLPGKSWFGGAMTVLPQEEQWGSVTAVDFNTGRIRWQVKTPQPMIGGVLATAGGLVFAGEGNGLFKSYDARTGAVLWQYQAEAGVNAPPVLLHGRRPAIHRRRRRRQRAARLQARQCDHRLRAAVTRGVAVAEGGLAAGQFRPVSCRRHQTFHRTDAGCDRQVAPRHHDRTREKSDA